MVSRNSCSRRRIRRRMERAISSDKASVTLHRVASAPESLLSAICHPPSALCHPPSVIRPLPPNFFPPNRLTTDQRSSIIVTMSQLPPTKSYSSRSKGSRARSGEARQARADLILAAATELLEHGTFDTLTVAQVAAHAGIAKGSVFNYFATKEALGLAVAERETVSFYDSLDVALEHAHAPLSVGRTAAIVTLSALAHPALVRILPIVGAVLEHNVGEAEARQYKTTLLGRMTNSGLALERAFPGFRDGDGVRFLQIVHALMVGLAQLAEPAPAVRRAIAADEFAPLRVDFGRELTHALHHYLTGVTRLLS